MADIDDNSIPVAERGQAVDANLGNFDLSDVQEEIDELVRPAEENPDSSLMISSLLSPVSTNGESNLASRERISFPDFTSKDEFNTALSFSSLPETITVPGLGSLTFSGHVNLTEGIQSISNSTSSNETILESVSSWSPEEAGAVAIVSLMVPFILLSNLFVIVSVVRFRRLHTPTNYFITSLAAVDIFVALATPFGIMLEVFNFGGVVQPEDAVVCLIPNRVLMMACGVSVLTLATIAYDRHTALVSPLEYINIMTPRRVAVLVSLTWIYSAIIVWLPLMAGWYDLPSASAPCSSNLIHGKVPILFLSAIFVPSCIAIFVCYFRIFVVARHHAKAIAAVEFAVHRHLQVKFMIKDTKYAKTLALVIGVFLILWLPYLSFVFVQAVSSCTFNVWIQTYLILLTVFNSGINPWIYAFRNNELRAAFKRLFREFCRSKLCQSMDRRASLISAISGTPRLSRTDSRVASLVPEVTVYTINERLKKTLDFLDEQICDNKHSVYDNQQRRQTVSAVAQPSSTLLCVKSSLRQAASCSNLDSVNIRTLEQSTPRCRSFSVDFTLSEDTIAQIETNSYGVNNLYLELSPPDEDIYDRNVCAEIYGNESSDYSCDNVTSSHPLPSSSHTSVVLQPLTSSISLPVTSIYLQPPPPSSSRRSSTSSNSLASSFAQKPENKQNLPSSNPVTPSADYIQSQELQQQHTQVVPHQPLRHTHSLAYVQEAFIPGTSWRSTHCPENLTDAGLHHYLHVPSSPVHPLPNSTPSPTSNHHHILTHTQSCPIFDPITSYNLHYPQILDSRTSHHHLGKSNLHGKRLDFVSLVNREVEKSCNGRYLV